MSLHAGSFQTELNGAIRQARELKRPGPRFERFGAERARLVRKRKVWYGLSMRIGERIA